MPNQSGTPPAGGLQASLQLLQQLQRALSKGARAEQIAIIRQLLEGNAPLGNQWSQVASVALGNGEITLARRAMDCFVAANGGSHLSLYHKAVLLEQCGDLAGAYDLLCQLPEDVPDAAINAFSRGAEGVFLGQLEEAKARLELATRLRPQLGYAWVLLATSANLSADPALAERIIAGERGMEGAEPAQWAAYYHALGKVHADRGDHDRAFAAFARGAALMKELSPYSAEEDRRDAKTSVSGFTRERIDALARQQTEPTKQTIFVTGLPRSGTTLVQQILVSHSEVGDGAELNRLLLLAQEVGGVSCEAVARYGAVNGVPDAALLWRHWMDERFRGAARVVDKSIATTRALGLAAALLPEAPLIWLTRDPLDCAWSCYSTFFLGTVPWASTFEDIAAHFRIERALLNQWQDILGDRLLVLPYESLVTDPQTWIPRLLAHCGLPLEQQVFAPHETGRAVQTASAVQVRRPINRKGIGSAAPYRRFMEPFTQSYRPRGGS